MQSFVKVQQKLLVPPQEALDYGPVDDLSVSGDGVEVEIVVQVVRGPLDSPDSVSVLPVNSVGLDVDYQDSETASSLTW